MKARCVPVVKGVGSRAMNHLQIAFLILLLAKTAADFWLERKNRTYVLAKADEFEANGFATAPKLGDGLYANYRKTVNYTVEKTDFGMVETAWDALWSAALVLFLYAPLWAFAGSLLGADAVAVGSWAQIWREGVALAGISVVLSLTGIPFDLYSTFRIEEKYGFNKSGAKLWITDQLKSLALGFVIGVPLVWALSAFYHALPRTWWIFAACAVFAFQLALIVVFPKWILPLFNKLSPLPEGELRERLEALAKRAGFVAEKIEVIDGSKRSGHSNAFFTGFGKWRRIVIYDTLIAQLSPAEIEAVLAHEIGHSRRGHVAKGLVFAAFACVVVFGLVGWALGRPEFFTAFGFEFRDGFMFVPALLLLGKIFPLFGFWLSPLTNRLSRRHEYEADAFARELTGTPEPLISALEKLHTENLANLTPHPIYSAFHYSHPTLFERAAALRGEAK
ncbi:MAG: M48 family metallopeptidase [Candidatus Spyradosoma sp.]